MHEEVARLPEKYRAAVVLCYFEGLTHDQAAAALCWPVGTVRGYLARARDVLRTRLVRRGVAPALAIRVLDAVRSSAETLAPSIVEGTLQVIATASAASTGALASGAMLRGLAIARARKAFLPLLVLTLGFGGAGLVAMHLGSRHEPEDSSSRPQTADPQPTAKQARQGRVDRYGDPVPDGAVVRMGTIRFNHASGVSGLAFTPDGKSLVSFSTENGTARVWDPATGRERHTIDVEALRGGRVFTMTPDGKSLLGADLYYKRLMFRVWDLESGRESHRVALPDVPGLSLLYSPDGKTLATRLPDQAVIFWDAETLHRDPQAAPAAAESPRHLRYGLLAR